MTCDRPPVTGWALTAHFFAGKAFAKPDGGNTANSVRSERKQRQQTLSGVRPTKAATEIPLRLFYLLLKLCEFELLWRLRANAQRHEQACSVSARVEHLNFFNIKMLYTP